MKKCCTPTCNRAGIYCKLVFFFSFLLINSSAWAQLELTADRSNAVYDAGETVQFQVRSSDSGPATYKITHDKYTMPIQSGTINLQAGIQQIISFNAADPALILCTVEQNGQTIKAAAAISPLQLKPLEDEPTDFDAFWNLSKAELAAIPIDAQLTAFSSTSYSTTYKVSLASVAGRRVYGYISIPAGAGPFPAILTLPAFGSIANVATPDISIAEKGGAISMSISIHNAEPDQVDVNAYQPDEITDPNNMYDRLAVLAGIRAIDYLFSRADFDGQSLGVVGVSQGGGLSLMLAGIDDRVKLLAHSNSTHCQHSGLKYEQASGFPYYLNRSRSEVGTPSHEQSTLAAAKYFDAVYFARRFSGPSLTIISYEDETCPPATVFAAYNQLKGQKVLVNAKDLGHDHPTEYWDGRFDFFRRHFPATLTPPWPWPSTTTGYFINAGADRNIDISESLALAGSVDLNGLALSNLPVEWTLVEGPGNVSFTSATSYNTSATFSEPGTYVLRLTANDYQQLSTSAKFYTLSDELTILVDDSGDTNPPQVVLSTPATDVTGPFQVTVTFNEAITGFEAGDLTITNANFSNFSGSGQVYTLDLTPIQEGEVRISLPSGKLQDLAGNFNEASNTLLVNFKLADIIKPSVVLSTAATEVSGPFEVQITFSEPVNGLGTDDFIVNNGTVSSLNGAGSSYVLTVAPVAEGEVSVLLPEGRVTDQAGNFNTLSNVLKVNYVIEDLQRPGVLLSTANSAVNGPFEVLITFSEPVTGLELADFQLTNGMAQSLNGTAGSYQLQVVPTVEGQVLITLPEGVAADLAGNTSFSSNTLNVLYQIEDTTPPSVTLTTLTTTVNGPFEVVATFTEEVNGLLAADFVVSNGTAGLLAGAGKVYRLQVNPLSPGQVSIALPAQRVSDLAGNGNQASNLLIVQFDLIDTNRPKVTLSTATSGVTGNFAVNVIFDETINGLDISDFLMNNASPLSLSGSLNNYELIVRPENQGQIFVNLPAGAVVDGAGNSNEASNVLEVQFVDPNAALLVLNANGVGRKVAINWATNTEFKNARFELERSVDNINYEVIHKQGSENDGTILYNYSYTDLAPESGDNYYRLKQIFVDSSFVYSNIQQLFLEFDLNAFVIFPNPTTDKAFINLREFAGDKAEIEVRNKAGYPVLFREIEELPEYPIEFDLGGFQNGIYYFLFSIKGTKRFSHKLILMR